MSSQADGSAHHRRRVAWFRAETTAGILLLTAAVVALAWANSPWEFAYRDLSQTIVGPTFLDLRLTSRAWATEGLLALFFFVVGAELKQEFVTGSLRSPQHAAVPILAAVGGMLVPALIYTLTAHVLDDGSAAAGWAIPTATDIAFAVGVLAVFGRGLPMALRTFLLTLAIVDDLLAIVVIALFYGVAVNWAALSSAVLATAVFAVCVRRPTPMWWSLCVIALVAWWAMLHSGIHAALTGVMLGFVVPARPVLGESTTRASRYSRALAPISTLVALPLFAFFAAGVPVVAGGGMVRMLSQPSAVAVLLALVVGKPMGVLCATVLLTRMTSLRLAPELGIRRLLPVGVLTGVGFTVSLLVSGLAFDDEGAVHVTRLAVLVGSSICAAVGAILLRVDAYRFRRSGAREEALRDQQPLIGESDA